MTEDRTTFEIESSRLSWYFRIRWGVPLATVYSLVSASILASAKGSFPDSVVVMTWCMLAAIIVGTYVAAPVYVNAFEYWIEGTTVRINQGVLVRKFKSIPLDRVTDIELVQGPLMRAFGVWSLQIQTAGSAQQSPEGAIWGAHDPESVRDTIVTIRDQAASKSG